MALESKTNFSLAFSSRLCCSSSFPAFQSWYNVQLSLHRLQSSAKFRCAVLLCTQNFWPKKKNGEEDRIKMLYYSCSNYKLEKQNSWTFSRIAYQSLHWAIKQNNDDMIGKTGMVNSFDVSLSSSFIRKKRPSSSLLCLFFLMKLELSKTSKLSTIPVLPIMSLFKGKLHSKIISSDIIEFFP